MKSTCFFKVVFLLFILGQTFAQNSAETTSERWFRFETEQKDFSFSIPPNYLVDAKYRDYGRGVRILVIEKDLEIQISHFTKVDKFFYGPTYSSNNPPPKLKVGKFTVLSFVTAADAVEYEQTLWVMNKNDRYEISIIAKGKALPKAVRFLASLRIENKQLFAPKTPVEYPEESIPLKNLKTSPEVTEAYERKIDKSSAKVIFSNVSSGTETDGPADLTRRAIIVERPSPRSPGLPQTSIPSVTTYQAVLKVQFLANGQIGEIVVLSSNDAGYAEVCADVAKNIRFVPAMKEREKVDSIQILQYTTYANAIKFQIPRY